MKKTLALFLVLTAGCAEDSDDGFVQEIAVDSPGSPKALDCLGTTREVSVQANGRFYYNERPAHTIYIIDETRRTIFVISDPSKIEDSHNFCDRTANCQVEVTPQNVRGVMIDSPEDSPDGQGFDRSKEITLDRNSGRILDYFRWKSSDGSQTFSNDDVTCSTIEVPISYREEVGPPRF